LANTDLNGDSVIDAIDLAIILAGWGSSSATLLVNPVIGDQEVVAADHDVYPTNGATALPVRRIWDTGLVESAMFHIPIGSGCDCGDSGGYYCDCISSWTPWEATLSTHMRLGDVNADQQVNGMDLAEILTTWGHGN
jgi:hypothetical protein